MNRRDFIISTTAGAALALPVASAVAQTPQGRKRALMKLGCQSGPTSDQRLQFFARHGVRNICGVPEIGDKELGYPTVDDLLQLKERAAKWDISIDMLPPPFLASSHIDRTERPAIMLGQSPERDRDIDRFQNLIRNCAKAEIPAIKYNMSILGVLRTGRTPGRGGVGYSTWRLRDATPRTPLTRAGRVTAGIHWERITSFLQRVGPFGNEHKIRLCYPPHYPGVPPLTGYSWVA